MKKAFSTIVLSALMATGLAQTKDDGQELIKTFFNLYKTKGYEAAVRYSWSTNKWIPAAPKDMNAIILSLGNQVDQMGEFLGQEELKTKKLGSRFRIVSYLVYYQRDPIRFTFELYKNDKGWEFTNFEYDTLFEEEIEDAMRLNAPN